MAPDRKLQNIFKVLLFTAVLRCSLGYMVDSNPYRRKEILDGHGNYQLEWIVDWSVKTVDFCVTVKTVGYVGFGLSSNGKMTGADLVMGGVAPDGTSYFADYHAVGSQMPEIDPHQDWFLSNARENGTHTILRFSRDFDTLDDQDYPITESKISLIWSYGEDDNVKQFHHENRGSYNIYLIHPDYTPEHDLLSKSPIVTGNDIKLWTIQQSMQIPATDTTYWCTVHAAPRLSRKHQIIGINVRFDNEESRTVVHHIQLSRCNPPRSSNPKSIFAPLLKHKGHLCYRLEAPTGPIPTQHCTHLVIGQAIGNRIMFNPPHVGIPIGFSPDEYYLLQVHYDNPQRRADISVGMKYDLYYTGNIREHDGGAIGVGKLFPGTPPSLLIPPHSIDYKIQGHCGETCTRKMLPPEGIRIFALTPHTHNSGRKMRLDHYRSGKQLEPIVVENNYQFDFQQFRVLNKEFHVLPGDHLVMNCEYDNTWHNGTTVGGYSTRQEMCIAFILYYNKIDFSVCNSEIISESARRRFLAGIGNVTWTESQLDYVVDSPHPLAGLTVTEVSNNHVHWSIRRRKQLQQFHLDHPQVNYCVNDGDIANR